MRPASNPASGQVQTAMVPRVSPAAVAQAEREVAEIRKRVERDLWGLLHMMERWQANQPPHRNERSSVVAVAGRHYR